MPWSNQNAAAVALGAAAAVAETIRGLGGRDRTVRAAAVAAAMAARPISRRSSGAARTG